MFVAVTLFDAYLFWQMSLIWITTNYFFVFTLLLLNVNDFLSVDNLSFYAQVSRWVHSSLHWHEWYNVGFFIFDWRWENLQRFSVYQKSDNPHLIEISFEVVKIRSLNLSWHKHIKRNSCKKIEVHWCHFNVV